MDVSEYFRFFVALCFVLSLIGGLALLARKMGWTHGHLGYVKPDTRLKIVESIPLDTRRRAMILRRDNVEHLIVLSATSELLIETGIPADEKTQTSSQIGTPETPADLSSKIVAGVFAAAGGKG